jgi:hypothetical protein
MELLNQELQQEALDMPIQNALTAVMEIKAGSPNYDPEKELKILLLSQQDIIFGAIQKLGFLHFGRFVFFDMGDPKDPKYFAIITTYDFDFEDYINVFIDELGELFNTMLLHIKQDFVKDPIDVRQQRRQFIEFVRNVDRTNPTIIQQSMDSNRRRALIGELSGNPKKDMALFYSAYPDLSVQQIWRMQEDRYA